MKVNWTSAALANLRSAEWHIAVNSKRYAQSLVERIFDRADLLETHPYLGWKVPEFEDESLREVFEHPYRIVYRLLTESIDIVAVVHAARTMPKDL